MFFKGGTHICIPYVYHIGKQESLDFFFNFYIPSVKKQLGLKNKNYNKEEAFRKGMGRYQFKYLSYCCNRFVS